jgi:hemerythrin-like domain-containing protein
MNLLLDRLAEDHRRLTHVMVLLEGLLDRFSEGVEPDYELMCELMEYLIDYADQVHHPSEDLIFERVLAMPGQDHEVLRRLLHQHEALAQLNRRFKESLEGIVHEEVLPRDEVEIQGRQLLAALRDHMRLEDEDAFPLAAELLSDADWMELAAAAPSAQDPVFGQADPERFRSLYGQLQEEMRQ